MLSNIPIRDNRDILGEEWAWGGSTHATRMKTITFHYSAIPAFSPFLTCESDCFLLGSK